MEPSDPPSSDGGNDLLGEQSEESDDMRLRRCVSLI
jgi:hypothetical protein